MVVGVIVHHLLSRPADQALDRCVRLFVLGGAIGQETGGATGNATGEATRRASRPPKGPSPPPARSRARARRDDQSTSFHCQGNLTGLPRGLHLRSRLCFFFRHFSSSLRSCPSHSITISYTEILINRLFEHGL